MLVRRGICLSFIARMFGAYVLTYSNITMVLNIPLNVAACSAMATTLQHVSAQPVGLISYTNYKVSFQGASVRYLYVTCSTSYYDGYLRPSLARYHRTSKRSWVIVNRSYQFITR